jgi:phosphoglycerate dehydrogenase-like enzyme
MKGGAMLSVLIERPSSGEGDHKSVRTQFRGVAKAYPEIARRLSVDFCASDEEREAKLASAEVFVAWRFPKENLARRAPHLKWIQLTGAGVEHLMPLDWLPPGAALTNCSGVHGPKLGEFATMALLMLHTHMPFFATAQRQHRWDKRFAPLIGGRTAVIVGMGGMGTAAARSARRLGLKVIGVNRSGRPHRLADRSVSVGQLHRVLPKADFLLLAAPLTQASRGLIGRAELALLKPKAGIINVGRGGLIDEAALAAALKAGRISGAILDVFSSEPLPPSSPLWDTPNLLVVPHVSADDAAQYMPRNFELFFRNCRRFFAGRALLNRIDPALEY